MRNFIDRVDNILKNHSGFVVKTLKFCFGVAYTKKDLCYLDHLDSWLQIAVKPGIEELELTMSTYSARYNFPCSLLSGGMATSLRSLFLVTCGFHPTVTSGRLRSLARLVLYEVCIEEEELRCLLSNTPALEWLDVRCCYPITSIRIPCLQQLSHIGVSCTKRCTALSIESKVPSLSSFLFQGDIRILLSLGDTLLQIKELDMSCEKATSYALTELSSSMPSLETLTIYSYSGGEEANTPTAASKFLHLRSLTISSSGSAYDLLSVVNFLCAAPSLETLVLIVERSKQVSTFADLPLPGLRWIMPEYRHEKLKSVKIFRFSSAKSVVEFTCHIMESASSLERLTLDTTCGVHRCSVSQTGKCWSMSTEEVVEARRAVLAVERYIKPKVPSIVELNVLEPCSRCHAAQLLMAGYHNDSTQ
ncbi:unnamed protein product [Urochloa decumbens]|uniref:At1g61320/AtMIF1 LRR domain-containing protein n=1 Tax=Urochloa decumbens TaxID=240449 RepID=A0ABC9BCG6_9POAL